jgi:hypothetical protein
VRGSGSDDGGRSRGQDGWCEAAAGTSPLCRKAD